MIYAREELKKHSKFKKNELKTKKTIFFVLQSVIFLLPLRPLSIKAHNLPTIVNPVNLFRPV